MEKLTGKGHMNIRVGVIGTGIMGADHVSTLHRQISGAQVSMVADVDRSRAQAIADGIPGVRATGDGFALIADPEVDAVVIASHDSTHAELAVAAVHAGKPVLCEKPLAPTVAECLRAERGAVGPGGSPLVSLGFMRRFDPGHVQLKAALDAGEGGAPLVLHCISRGVSSGPGASDESSVTGSAIHEFDVVPWLLESPIVEVSWHAPRCSSKVTGLQDPQLLLLRTADGALSTVEVFLNARYGYDVRCEIVCEHGTLALTEPLRVVRDGARQRATDYPADWRPRFADAYRFELQAWIDGIAGGQPSSAMASAHDGLVAGAVAEAVIRSMHEDGRTVPVAPPAIVATAS
jgi:myo-inositol 2-dehydrogenase/D-chiro-inositol 1-dehydrogenase